MKLFLKSTPLPTLVRHFLAYQGGDSFRLVEDFRFPPEVDAFLKEQGILSDEDSFFLKERSQLRTALVVEKGRESHYDPGLTDRARDLQRSLSIWMDAAGKKSVNYRIIPFYRLGYNESIYNDATVYLLIVWRPEKSFVEQVLSGDSGEQLPGYHLESVENEVGASLQEKNLEEDERLPMEPIDPAWEQWKSIGYRVAGQGSFGIKRKMYLLRGENRMRISLLQSTEDLSEHYVLSFFDRIRSATDSVLSHMDLLRSAPVSGVIKSFTAEVSGDGNFSCTGYGIAPVVYRAKSGRLREIPEMTRDLMDKRTGATKRRVRKAAARLRSGDILLLLAKKLSSDQKDHLCEILGSENGQGEDNLAKISAWLIAERIGRTMIIRKWEN